MIIKMSWDDLRASFMSNTQKAGETPKPQQQTSQVPSLHKAFSSVPCLTTFLSQGRSEPEQTLKKWGNMSSSQADMDDSWDENADFVQELVMLTSQYDAKPMDTNETIEYDHIRKCGKSSYPTSDSPTLSRPNKRAKVENDSMNVLSVVALPQITTPSHSGTTQREANATSSQVGKKRKYEEAHNPNKVGKVESSEDIDVSGKDLHKLIADDHLYCEAPIEHPMLKYIVERIPHVFDEKILHGCFQTAVDLCLNLLTNVIVELRGTRSYQQKDYATQSFYNWWIVKSVRNIKEWFPFEHSPLLRMTLAVITELLRAPSEKFGMYDASRIFKMEAFQFLRVGPLSFETLCSMIDKDSPNNGNSDSREVAGVPAMSFSGNLTHQEKIESGKHFNFSGPFDTVDSDPMSDYDVMVASSSSSVSPVVQIRSIESIISYTAKQPSSPTSVSLSPAVTEPAVTCHPSVEQVAVTTHLKIKHTESASTFTEMGQIMDVSHKPTTSNLHRFLLLLFDLVDLAVTHPEAHLLEGNLCAVIELIGELGADQDIDDGGIICRTLCRSLCLTLSPNLLLSILKAVNCVAPKNRSILLSLCRKWQSKTDKHQCFLLGITDAVEYVLNGSGENQSPKNRKLSSQFNPVGQANAPVEYIHELLTEALKLPNLIQPNGPWYNRTDKKTCQCYSHLLHVVLKQTFLAFYKKGCKIRVFWAKEVLKEFSGAEFKMIPHHGLEKVLSLIRPVSTTTWRNSHHQFDDSQDSEDDE
ncbi:hypothetical protein B566_EDAN003819 [Ephemera danica]|nr:hypothetical protein B566_EDAN003819 [Ephemera danica]